jgi:hypothetical protein
MYSVKTVENQFRLLKWLSSSFFKSIVICFIFLIFASPQELSLIYQIGPYPTLLIIFTQSRLANKSNIVASETGFRFRDNSYILLNPMIRFCICICDKVYTCKTKLFLFCGKMSFLTQLIDFIFMFVMRKLSILIKTLLFLWQGILF